MWNPAYLNYLWCITDNADKLQTTQPKTNLAQVNSSQVNSAQVYKTTRPKFIRQLGPYIIITKYRQSPQDYLCMRMYDSISLSV